MEASAKRETVCSGSSSFGRYHGHPTKTLKRPQALTEARRMGGTRRPLATRFPNLTRGAARDPRPLPDLSPG